MNPIGTSSVDHFDALTQAVSNAPPLSGLDPDAYARGHAAFERRSSQRGLIADWLVERLTGAGSDSLAVLSVGCGDGDLDAVVAERLVADPSRKERVRYVGVEPFEGSSSRFSQRMGAIDAAEFSTRVHVSHFDEAQLDETFDAVTFVHSMYYVPDVLGAVEKAARHLRNGGEVLVLSAPRGELNRLAGLLAPSMQGHDQWFSDDVHKALVNGDLAFTMPGTIDAVVDLTDADDDVLDFTVQAGLTASVRELVRRYLAEVSLVPGRSVVAHPVDVYALSS